MNNKNNKFVGIISTKTIQDAFRSIFNRPLHPLFGGGHAEGGIVTYFRDVNPKSGFIRYKCLIAGFTPEQLQALQSKLPEAKVKAWKTQKWAWGRGEEVICIYVPIEQKVESASRVEEKRQLELYNQMMRSHGRCL